MGYVFATGHCIACGKVICFHPNLVPSIRHPETGRREPVCRACIEKANPERVKNGLDPVVIHPDAYDAADENSILWEG